MTQPDPSSAETGAEQHVCQFPVSFEPATGEFEVAGHPLPESPSRRGRKAEYCGEERIDPDGIRRRHDRATAFQRRRELQLEAAGQAPKKAGPAPQPVTSARASLRELLAQIEITATAHRNQMGEMLDRVAEIVATAGDPDAAVAEVARIRTEARAEVEAAQARAGEAEADAIAARRERDRAVEDKVLAEGAAEDAIADRDAQVAAARAEVEQARRDADQAGRDAAAAREELATVTAAAEERIGRIETDAQERIAQADERARQAIEVRNQAEAARAGAEQTAGDARAEVERLRGELTQLRRDMAAARTEAREDRDQLRSDHALEVARIQESAAAQVSAMQAALSTAETTITRLESEISRQKGAQ